MDRRSTIFLLLALLGALGTTLANTAADNHQWPAVPQGLSAWNSALYVHHTNTLLIRGDVFVFTAHIQGNGSLLVQDAVSRAISLPQLVIDNPDTVSLRGQGLGTSESQGIIQIIIRHNPNHNNEHTQTHSHNDLT